MCIIWLYGYPGYALAGVSMLLRMNNLRLGVQQIDVLQKLPKRINIFSNIRIDISHTGVNIMYIYT